MELFGHTSRSGYESIAKQAMKWIPNRRREIRKPNGKDIWKINASNRLQGTTKLNKREERACRRKVKATLQRLAQHKINLK